MVKWNPDLMLLDSAPTKDGAARAVFMGIDWGRKDWTGLVCPRCQMPHRWRKRTPRQCRKCELPFRFTASEVTDTDR